jgi:hypothetical protein
MSHFVTAAPLAREQIGQAYPLIRSLMPGLDLAGWTRIAAPLTNGSAQSGSGILTVCNDAGYIRGLCAYSIAPDDGQSRLVAEHFVAFDVTDRAPIAATLLSAIDTLARSLGCVAVHSWLDGSQQGLLPRFVSAGYTPRRILVCKELGRAEVDKAHDA